MPPFFLMKNGLFLLSIAIFIASLALSQSTTNGTSPKKAIAKKADAKTASTKSAFSKKGKSSRKSASSAQSRQMTPTPERYRDIQQALVDKGYLKSEPNGIWDAQSADALRQFQTDQNLSPTGKISSASLIGLGLGPKTSQPEPPSAAPKPPEASPAPPPPTAEN